MPDLAAKVAHIRLPSIFLSFFGNHSINQTQHINTPLDGQRVAYSNGREHRAKMAGLKNFTNRLLWNHKANRWVSVVRRQQLLQRTFSPKLLAEC